MLLCTPDWAYPTFDGLLPGAHVVAMGPYQECIEARRAGFEVRDTVLVVSPEGTSFAFLLRKPLAGTVADNVLRHGVGALNIDGCRVAHASAADFAQHKAGVEALKARGGSFANSWKNSSDLSGASDVTTKGRWPTNLVFIHGAGCKRAGVKRIEGARSVGFGDGSKVGGVQRYGDEDGMETVAAWSCEPGCPVVALDEMSGERPAGTFSGARQRGLGYGSGSSNKEANGTRPSTSMGASGGASRFFPQFEGRDALLAWLARLIGVET